MSYSVKPFPFVYINMHILGILRKFTNFITSVLSKKLVGGYTEALNDTITTSLTSIIT